AVTLDPDSCQCEDFALRGPVTACLHVHAARIVRERDHGGKPVEIDTAVIPVRLTYKQDWPAYNLAPLPEKKRLQRLLHDLFAGREAPPKPKGKPGRKPTPMRDMVFACAFKVYSTFSSRRFACDLQDAFEKGYLSQLMHAVTICSYLENPALTPVLQRLI